ncbi:sugar fermentation stimulation protein [Candidatus Endolissoclinum faulkneri L5]|uniref:Sugar fermentation stimulation protein homolog n=1 Tax=Candidatus Endolissoclinum faulkneri L5 TaxID=1401328 RepID=V9TSM2_9PROT|nr:DNA/RNA nuclease SfsA [Candidatus Endolissoclinum faulkneri]AHC73914.1 sugar fermentation stimulation protein [Candidatus Endolissoclinum faulkneri L5]
MKLPDHLQEGCLIKRYNRFLVDVDLGNNRMVSAYCPNTGAMTGLSIPGMRVWLSRSHNFKNKLAYILELVEINSSIVGIHTGRANTIVEEAITDGLIPEIVGYKTIRREVKYELHSRIDILLETPFQPPCYVEVKNVHLIRSTGPSPGYYEFPDSVTSRGVKHLDNLTAMAAAGNRSMIIFCIQRSDSNCMTIARDIDPKFGLAFDRARAAGVEAIAWDCKVNLTEIVLKRSVPIVA